MTLRVRPLLSAFILLPALAPALHAERPAGASDRITAAANVTLRALPSAGSDAVAQLPLGTELGDAGPAGLDKTWLRVKLADGREGWILGSLTRTLDNDWRWPVFDRIIEDRLGRKGDGFTARAELVAFIERVAPEYTNTDGRARLELWRAQALSLALAAIPRNAGRRDPYANWLDSHKDDVIFDPPGGRWMLSSVAIWDRQARTAGTSVADDLGWLAVTNGLAGECGGRLACYVEARNRLHGEYLRRQPNGRHAADAVAVIKETADALAGASSSGAGYTFDAARDCQALAASLDALRSAVDGTHLAGSAETMASLDAVRRVCR
jgi:hypothetical protein